MSRVHRFMRLVVPALLAGLLAAARSQAGTAYVSGITYSPSTVYASPDLTPNITSSFTLKEVAGSSITFTEVALAVHRGDGTFFFDVGKYANVTVPANGTWTFPATAKYLAAPGSYQLVAKYRFNNGPWSNFGVTGSGVNPRSFTVQSGVSIHGHVSSQAAGAPAVAGARVQWGSAVTTTDVNGNYVFTAIPCQTATLTVSLWGYTDYSGSYTPTCNAVSQRDVALAPWGSACVASGVSVTPATPHASVSSSYRNFSVNFTLGERSGFPITFAEVGVAILDGNNNYLFDLDPPNLQNVTVPAGGTWTYPTKSGYLVNPGTYKAVVRGHVAGGNWFDFCVAGGANPTTFTVLPRLSPTVSVSPSSGAAGTVFSQPGSGFSPNGTVELHFRKPPPPAGDGLEYTPPATVQADASGNYSHTYNSSSASMLGTYSYYAIDLLTGATSGTVTFQVLPPLTPTVAVSPSSGPAGTLFSQPGTGFTPNGLVDLYFRKPPPPDGDGLEFAPPARVQADASGAYTHSWNSTTATMFGTYQYRAVDLASGTQSNVVSFQVTQPAPVTRFVYPLLRDGATTPTQSPIGGGWANTNDFGNWYSGACGKKNPYHPGQDITRTSGAKGGHPVFAVFDGQVSHVRLMSGSLGHAVIIRHDLIEPRNCVPYFLKGTTIPESMRLTATVSSAYLHVSNVLVAPGDPVVAGQHIADIDPDVSGFTPHLHFEMRANDSVREVLSTKYSCGYYPTQQLISDFGYIRGLGFIGGVTAQGNDPPPTPGGVDSLLSTSHVPGVWSSQRDIELSWDPPQDPGGLAGYAYAWSPSAVTDPGTTIVQDSVGCTGVGAADGAWYFSIRSVSGVGVAGPIATAGPFWVDGTSPNLTMSQPAGGDTWFAGTTHPIRWVASDNVALARVLVDYSLHGALGPWEPILDDAVSADSVLWTVPNAVADSACVRVRVRDLAGNETAVHSGLLHLASSVAAPASPAYRFALREPAPNPAGERQQLRFSLAQPQSVSLEIFGVNGQRLWSRVVTGLGPGEHSVTWDGKRQEDGSPVRGICFLRLSTSSGTRMVKLVRL